MKRSTTTQIALVWMGLFAVVASVFFGPIPGVIAICSAGTGFIVGINVHRQEPPDNCY